MSLERYSVMNESGRKLCAVLAAAIILLFCGCGTARAEAADLFDAGDVHRIDITLSDEDWSDLLSHPIDKTKYKADLLIDGEPVNGVSFATKGTSSLLISAHFRQTAGSGMSATAPGWSIRGSIPRWYA